jgi:CDP-glucose 4,6-dehydratase
VNLSFYQNKKVLITGHTGFKGTWLSRILIDAQATVIGYALENEDKPSFFALSGNEKEMISIIGDVRDIYSLKSVFEKYQPEIVFHLAAQPLVRLSYEKPHETFETNIMGTVNVLECVRLNPCVKSFVNVTTDKVYLNTEQEIAYKEEDRLDGYDPYSNSKSCSELVTSSYVRSFFNESACAISTARSGNVIGGGDFAKDRIIPDCAKAASQNKIINVRNPYSTRPYQHVLETLRAYLMIAQAQYMDKSMMGAYNIGPNLSDNLKTGKLVELFCDYWEDAKWESQPQVSVHEANLLQLDHTKITNTLGWTPIWDASNAIEKSVEWYKAFYDDKDMKAFTIHQIRGYFDE